MVTANDGLKLLVLRHHGLGDLITVQPALHALRRAFPRHHLVTTCPSWLVPLAEFFATADALTTEKTTESQGDSDSFGPTCHQKVDAALLANILNEIQSVDVLISLRTPGPELLPIVDNLRPRQLVSYHFGALPETSGFPELDFSDHILTRWYRLLQTVGIKPQSADLYCRSDFPGKEIGNTIVHIGAGSPSRLWPPERWVQVIDYLRKHGHQIVLTGCKAEANMVSEACRRARLPAKCNRSGTDDIREIARLVAGARLVVCVDTGISHMATAFRRPAITLFGPVPPAWWGPPPDNPQHRTIWTGRTGDNYNAASDPGLMEIEVEDVLHAINDSHAAGI